jgi:hypothetical protein
VRKPRLLLVPGFTELEWVIKPRLEQWAEVASYDPPGVGEEPLTQEQQERLQSGEAIRREAIAKRGLDELERRGWDRCFLVSDGDGNGASALIAQARPEAIQGMALGHATLSYDMEGERAPINKEVWLAMRQLLQQDYPSFVRHGIVQLTQGAYRDELAERMLERFPRELVEGGWDMARDEPVDIGEILLKVGCPLLLAKHDGCLGFTEEGFEDAVAAFPEARTLSVPEACAVSDRVADALRSFCLEVMEMEGSRREQAVQIGSKSFRILVELAPSDPHHAPADGVQGAVASPVALVGGGGSVGRGAVQLDDQSLPAPQTVGLDPRAP